MKIDESKPNIIRIHEIKATNKTIWTILVIVFYFTNLGSYNWTSFNSKLTPCVEEIAVNNFLVWEYNRN